MSLALEEGAVQPEVTAPEVQDESQNPQDSLQSEGLFLADNAPRPSEEDSQERNWREMRRAMQELKRQNEELRSAFTSRQSEHSESREAPLEADDFVRGAHLQRSVQTLEQRLREQETKVAMADVRSRYPDYDEVVSEENVEWLKQNKPHLAISISSLQKDPYQMALAAYDVLKATGGDMTAQKKSQYNQKRLAENATRPTSVHAPVKQGGGALSEANRFANGLTPDLKKSLLQEMRECSKRAH